MKIFPGAHVGQGRSDGKKKVDQNEELYWEITLPKCRQLAIKMASLHYCVGSLQRVTKEEKKIRKMNMLGKYFMSVGLTRC